MLGQTQVKLEVVVEVLELVFCQTPVLGLRLGVDFTFAPLHISPATFAHIPGNLCIFSGQPLHISPATFAHFPSNRCTFPRQPAPTPKFFHPIFDPIIGIELYKILNRFEFNFLIHVTVEPSDILIFKT